MSRWQLLLEHAEQQTENAARSMSALEQQISAVNTQRQQMEEYRRDYAQRASTPGMAGTIQQLKTIRHFSDQVQLTVGELDSQLSSLRVRYDQARSFWQDQYNREQALRALQKLDLQKRAVTEEKIRRREEDDFALLSKRRREGR